MDPEAEGPGGKVRGRRAVSRCLCSGCPDPKAFASHTGHAGLVSQSWEVIAQLSPAPGSQGSICPMAVGPGWFASMQVGWGRGHLVVMSEALTSYPSALRSPSYEALGPSSSRGRARIGQVLLSGSWSPDQLARGGAHRLVRHMCAHA